VNKPLQSFLTKEGYTFVGDQSTETKKPIGRGILICTNGVIHIGFSREIHLPQATTSSSEMMVNSGDIYVN